MLSAFMYGQIERHVYISGIVEGVGDGEPLIGVTVGELGTSNGVMTDLDGKYYILVKENATLVFHYIGYHSLYIPIGNARVINVRLREDNPIIVTPKLVVENNLFNRFYYDKKWIPSFDFSYRS